MTPFLIGLVCGAVAATVAIAILSVMINEAFIRTGRGPLTLTISGETRERVRKLQELTEADARNVTAKALAVYDLLMRHHAEGWDVQLHRAGEQKGVVLK